MATLSIDAEQVHRDAVVCVVHDHRPIAEDLPRMRAGGVTSKIYQVTLDVDVEAGVAPSRDRTQGWLELGVAGLAQALREIDAHPEACLLATSAADVRRAKREGRAAIMLGTEGTRWLQGSLDPLELFHRMGLRELQLAWAFANPLVPDGRLSDFGRHVVRACRELGLLVDLTHLPRQAFFDVVDAAEMPLIVSHGSAAAVTVDLDDDQLQALADTGGLLGIHFYNSYLGPGPKPEDVVRQVDYLAERVGIDHVALGVDFFPTHGAWHKLQIDQGATELEWAIDDMSGMPAITRSLLDHGYRPEDVKKVLGENFLRVCAQVMEE